MPVSRKGRLSAIWVLLAVALVTYWCWQMFKQVRQARLDRALITAIKEMDTEKALSALNAGADANARDESPRPQSLWQIFQNIVLGRGYRVNQHGSTALFVLLDSMQKDVGDGICYFPDGPPENTVLVKALLNKGADVNVRDDTGATPLSIAAERRDHFTVLLLLHRSARPDDHGRFGFTPLSWTARDGDVVAMKRLLDRGALLNARDSNGDTPLFFSIIFDQTSATRLLVSRGADINTRNFRNETVLHRAATKDYPDMVRLLLEIGADPTLKDCDGRTPLAIAQSTHRDNCQKIIKLLKPVKMERFARSLRAGIQPQHSAPGGRP